MNLAARAGRWSAAHWKTATFGWLAFVALAVVLGSLHGTISQTDAEQTNGQAAQAEQMLSAAHVKNVASENVLVHSRTLTASAPTFRRTVEGRSPRTRRVRHLRRRRHGGRARPAQQLAQTRPGARGALLMYSCLPVSEFGEAWPEGVPVEAHGKEDDPFFAEDLEAAQTLVAETDHAELFLYPGAEHLFADSSLPAYDADAAALLMERVKAFLVAV